MQNPQFVFLESNIVPDYYLVIDTVNKAMIRIIKNEQQLKVTISFDEQRIENFLQPYNCCNTLTQSQLISHIVKGFTKEQLTTIDKLINQLGS